MTNLQFAIKSIKGLEREALDPDNNRDRESPRPRIPLSLTIALFGEGLMASGELETAILTLLTSRHSPLYRSFSVATARIDSRAAVIQNRTTIFDSGHPKN
jgi:hypothetical protein